MDDSFEPAFILTKALETLDCAILSLDPFELKESYQNDKIVTLITSLRSVCEAVYYQNRGYFSNAVKIRMEAVSNAINKIYLYLRTAIPSMNFKYGEDCIEISRIDTKMEICIKLQQQVDEPYMMKRIMSVESVEELIEKAGDQECPVCFDALNEENFRMLSDCKHLFCNNCTARFTKSK